MTRVVALFGVGEATARGLCKRFGTDADELVAR
jgi:hypothetical protein